MQLNEIKEKLPLISVIVPAYNIENYLDDCINSIINQTYKNLEIIIINDGSSDKTGEIIEHFAKKDKRITAVHNKKNIGIMNTRIKGIKVAKADYIFFVDSDDYVKDNIIEKLFLCLIENNCDISFCTFISDHREIGGDVSFPKNSSKKIFIMEADEAKKGFYAPYFLTPTFHTNLIGLFWARLAKKKLLTSLSFPIQLRISEESIAMREIFSFEPRWAILDEPLYYWRTRKNSLQRTYSKKIVEDSIFAIKSIIISELELFDEYTAEEKMRGLDFGMSAIFTTIINLLRHYKDLSEFVGGGGYNNQDAKIWFRDRISELKELLLILLEKYKTIPCNKKNKFQKILFLHFPLLYKLFIPKIWEFKNRNSPWLIADKSGNMENKA
ncbi:MAG: glycosyltransferase family 2 protein [Clostridiales Family XIII bacterium]|nr:glycosyltransferase family 2 protein [Clostridiales Family XIII bacterium]